MAKFKPCKCGDGIASVLNIGFGICAVSMAVCTNVECDTVIVRYGLTKKHAERRAARAWNTRTDARRPKVR